ncbi:hypothetical protein SteCoe_8398 [Stentor coeruleus]|uniref:Uncharacterized protein n=1 Tax=Stentor coeruleus TaxID=5963 RepID=A0A1R2CKD9_9CILI|nr:hypothetical protein SteCoe_8398 [Stentor coeruleus]
MANLNDQILLKESPAYVGSAKTYRFKKQIKKYLNEEKLNSSRSFEISSSEESSELPFLVSPQVEEEKVIESIPQVHYENPPDTFKAYRKFVGRAVPVVRRREFQPITFQQINDAKLESPKIMSREKLRTRSSAYDITLVKEMHKLYQKVSSVPLALLKNISLENYKSLQSLRSTRTKSNSSSYPSKIKNQLCLSKQKKKSCIKLPSVLSQKQFLGVVKDYEGHFKYSEEERPKFLPARRRYKFL